MPKAIKNSGKVRQSLRSQVLSLLNFNRTFRQSTTDKSSVGNFNSLLRFRPKDKEANAVITKEFEKPLIKKEPIPIETLHAINALKKDSEVLSEIIKNLNTEVKRLKKSNG